MSLYRVNFTLQKGRGMEIAKTKTNAKRQNKPTKKIIIITKRKLKTSKAMIKSCSHMSTTYSSKYTHLNSKGLR